MAKPVRIYANSMLMALEIWLEIRRALARGKVVTHWRMEKLNSKDHNDDVIEFEIRVTRLGDVRIPRSQKLVDRVLKEAGQ